MSKTLTGAALKANRRKVLIQTATDAMTDGHPDAIVALLTEAEKARPTRNPEPLRDEVREAVEADRREFVEALHVTRVTGHGISFGEGGPLRLADVRVPA